MPAPVAAPAVPVSCRPDCRYFSSYTNTCDYALIQYHTRGCPRDACTRYLPRAAAQPVSRVSFDPEDGLYYQAACPSHDSPEAHAAHALSDKLAEENPSMYTPEPPVSPPEDDRYLTAGCGHEVYDGEDLFEWENGQTLCADCLSDRFSEMSIVERAELLGCEHRTVSLPGKSGCGIGHLF